jgi:ferric-dicitrate binding protein FerR (iron transport regulator)
MPNNQIYLLISRKLSGEATPEELERLQDLLAASTDQQFQAEILSAYFNTPHNYDSESDISQEEKIQRILHAGEAFARDEENVVGLTSLKSRRKWYFAAAAVFMIMFTSGWYFFHQKEVMIHQPLPRQVAGNPGKLKEVVTRSGARTMMVLPDGSKVWLNAGSKLRYDEDFNKKLREVELEGEGFFDVVKNPKMPFIVHTSDIDIRVLGTAFNVKSYAGDDNIEATLLRGQIEVVRKDDPSAPKVILKPNEKLIFSRAVIPAHVRSADKIPDTVPVSPVISITPVSGSIPDNEKSETSWLYNRLVFEGDSFAELARKMERWYDVKIVFRDERLQHIRLSGVFDNEGLEQALQALQIITPYSYEINGKEVVLYEK